MKTEIVEIPDAARSSVERLDDLQHWPMARIPLVIAEFGPTRRPGRGIQTSDTHTSNGAKRRLALARWSEHGMTCLQTRNHLNKLGSRKAQHVEA
jgi:hypothetical protein